MRRLAGAIYVLLKKQYFADFFGFFGGKTAVRYLSHCIRKSMKDRSAGGVGLI